MSIAACSRSSAAARADSAQPMTVDAAARPRLARRVQRERLAGAGRRADDLDAAARRRQGAHELGLLARSATRRAIAVLGEVRIGARPTPAVAAIARAVEQLALETELRRGSCSARSAAGARDAHDVTRSASSASTSASSSATARARRDAATATACTTSRRVNVRRVAASARRAVGARRGQRELLAGAAARAARSTALAVEAVLGGAGAPLLAQALDRDAVVLALAGGQRRGLRRAAASCSPRARCASTISARRREKCSMSSRENPARSAEPLRDLAPSQAEPLGDLRRSRAW